MTKSLLTVNALMPATFLLSFSNSDVVRALYVVINVVVIGFTLAMIVYLYVIPAGIVPELETLRIVLLIWGSFVIYNNLRSWLPKSGSDLEFIGFALFLCSLGYVVARRSLRTEEALLACATNRMSLGAFRPRFYPESMPQMPGLRVVAQYTPMSQVVGDFYRPTLG